MQIVSYPWICPQCSVSILTQKTQHCSQSVWWHIKDDCLEAICSHTASRIAAIPVPIIEGHYRYCNEFLWPLIHGQPGIARYSESDHNCFRSLNLTVAAYLNWSHGSQPLLVHDHQFALVPYYLSEEKASESIYFWHLPWPSSFPQTVETQLTEIVKGMLRSKAVGFHSAEYMESFCGFIKERLPEFKVAADGRAVLHSSGFRTELLVAPAGLDYRLWHSAARAETFQSIIGSTCLIGRSTRHSKEPLESIEAMVYAR